MDREQSSRTTDEEEAEAREAHFKDLLEREEPRKMKAGIENDVPERQIEWELDDPITQEEITKAIAKLKPTAHLRDNANLEKEESGDGRGVEDEKGFRAWHKREQARLKLRRESSGRLVVQEKRV